MAVVGISLLVCSVIALLAFRSPAATLMMLSRWLGSAPGSESSNSSSLGKAMPQDSARTSDQPDGLTEAHPEEGCSQYETHSDEITGDTTPKAKPRTAGLEVPSFTLDDSNTASDGNTAVFPASSPPQRAPSMAPPSKPLAPARPQSSLMPPPGARAPTTRAAPNAASSLRIPTSGPLPNRGPRASQAAQARASLAPMVKTPNARQKVVLEPGHSPLDWASLTRSGNLAGVPFQRVTPSMLKAQNGRKGRAAWSSYHGKVYDIKPYLPFHPGGEGELLRAAGKDGGKLFMEVHSWVNWESMLSSCLVGMLVAESEGEGLDGLD